MPRFRVIFFDVGNTLLFPNRKQILAPIPAEKHPTLAQWQNLERKTKREFDEGLLSGNVDHGFWWKFYSYLLEDLGALDEKTRDLLVSNTRKSENWDQILPGTSEALQRIREKYLTGIISNADGRIEVVLGRCGIIGCFRTITDSGIVGCEKPHRRIFEAALRSLEADPKESLYVGDVYSVDYVGARNAGMEALLFDVAGTYRDRDLPRVESLLQFESWLEQQN